MGDALPTFWLIAGPNGVGKTTFAFKRLKAVSGRQSAFRDEDVLADGHPALVRMVPA